MVDREWYKNFLPKFNTKLEVLQFNDVYNVEEKEDPKAKKKELSVFEENQDADKLRIKAGIARFINAFKIYNCSSKLVTFSGDLFFPSRMS